MRWLFYVHNALGLPALAEVFEVAARRSPIEAWFTGDNTLDLAASPAVDSDLYDRQFLPLAQARARSWDLVFATDNQKHESVPRGRRVRLAHGAAFGTSGYDLLSLARCDVFVALSEPHRRFLEKHRRATRASAEIIVGGSPGLDRALRRRRRRQEILHGLELDTRRPTVVIASHWARHTNLRTFGAALAAAVLASLPDANVVQTGHPNLWQRVQYEIGHPENGLVRRAVGRVRRGLAPFDYDRLFAELDALRRTNERFRLMPLASGFDLLPAADVLVSDWSSATVEFTLQDRPIVFFDSPRRPFIDPVMHAAFRDATHPFRRLAEVGPAVRTALARPAERRSERQKLRDLCVAHAGSSAERIVDLLAVHAKALPSGSHQRVAVSSS